MRRDGYLFLPGLLPRDDVAAVQRQVGEIARDAGWLRRDRPLDAAIAEPSGFCVDPDPTYLTTLRRINRLEDYHALKHHPVLIDLFERMLGGPILPHPRVLMRNIFPARDEFTTKAHQDFPNVQGTTEVYTAWMPLIDCPMHVGPLQIAAGSHTAGVYDFAHRRRRRRHRDQGSARRTLGLRRLRGRRCAAVPQHDGAQGRAQPQRPAAHVDGCALPTGQRAVQHRQRQS